MVCEHVFLLHISHGTGIAGERPAASRLDPMLEPTLLHSVVHCLCKGNSGPKLLALVMAAMGLRMPPPLLKLAGGAPTDPHQLAHAGDP